VVDTSLGNTIINLALGIPLTEVFTLKDLDAIYDVAINKMKNYGFTYTGDRPGPISQQTFLRGCFTIHNGHPYLIPSLGLLIKPLLRVKDYTKFGFTYDDIFNDPTNSKAATLLTAYYKSYFTSIREWAIPPDFRDLVRQWDTITCDDSELMSKITDEIALDHQYTIDWVDSDIFVPWDKIIEERYGYTRIDVAKYFCPDANFGTVLEENDFMAVMKKDYGVTPRV